MQTMSVEYYFNNISDKFSEAKRKHTWKRGLRDFITAKTSAVTAEKVCDGVANDTS